MSARIVPTTRGHVEAMLAEPLPFRIRAFTVIDGEKLLGFGGFAFLANGTVGAFVLITDEGRKYPVALHRAGLMVISEAKRLGYPRLVAMADEKQPAAVRWLERLGFARHGDEGAFVWTSKGART